ASPICQTPRGNFCLAVSIIEAELSRPTIALSGQRRRSASVLFPGPHPRSIIRRGADNLMRWMRSTLGCVRSLENFRYWLASHCGMHLMITSVEATAGHLLRGGTNTVAYALVRAASAILPTLARQHNCPGRRRDESRRGAARTSAYATIVACR